MGLTVAVPAGARTVATSLQAALGDGQAVGAALAAARDVPPADRLAVFAETYAQAADDGTTAEAVERLLGGDSMSGVLPAALARATVLAPTSTPAPAPDAAVLSRARGLAGPSALAPHTDRPLAAERRDPAPESRPRAP